MHIISYSIDCKSNWNTIVLIHPSMNETLLQVPVFITQLEFDFEEALFNENNKK